MVSRHLELWVRQYSIQRMPALVSTRLPGLTAARFAAAISIVAFHLGWFPKGFVSVSFFFVLSGFVLTFANIGSTSEFYKGRFLRIYPLYLVGLILGIPGLIYHFNGLPALILAPLMAQAWVPKFALIWNGPGWFVSAQAFLYLLTPILIRHRRMSMTVAALVVLTIWTPQGFHSIPLLNLPQFCLGMIGGFYFKSQKQITWGVPLVLSGLAIYLAPLSGDALYTGALAPLFLWLIYSLTKVEKCPSWLLILGDSSYALFILHYPIEFAFKAALHRSELPPMAAIAFLAVVIPLSIAATKFLDPAMRRVFARALQPRREVY